MNKKLIILTLILSTSLINASSKKNLKRSLPKEVDPEFKIFNSLLNAPEIYESFPDLEGLELILPVGITQKLLSEKEKKDMRLKANRERQKKRKAAITPEQRKKALEKQKIYSKRYRSEITPEKLAKIKKYQREYYQAKRVAMTPEELLAFNEKQRKLYQIRRAAMTPEQLEEVRRKDRDKKKKLRD